MQITFIEPARSHVTTSTLLHLPGVAVTAELLDILALGEQVVVAYSLSGGKDCRIMALNADAFLDTVGFTGQRVCVHADLDDNVYTIEWKAAKQSCKEIADYLHLPLYTVRRKGGGMITRWHQRWQSNVERYINLECVRLILPWSTASMRFCTQELKVSPLGQELTKRFPGKIIISVVGIRAEESDRRATADIFEPSEQLTKKKRATVGYTWNAIRDQTYADVYAIHQQHGLCFPATYTEYGLSRLSCRYCILASARDIEAATRVEESIPSYKAITRLEVESTYSFQSSRWLCDVAPHLLDADVAARVNESKEKAKQREAQEKRLPKHLLYTKDGWPKCIPTLEEAELIGDVRRNTAAIMDLSVKYTTAETVLERYTMLYQERLEREKEKAAKQERKVARDQKKQSDLSPRRKLERRPSQKAKTNQGVKKKTQQKVQEPLFCQSMFAL